MTDLEIMQRAKMYVDKLANGIDPLTDSPVAESDCINQVRISRCLFYVSGVLGKLIENGGVVGKRMRTKKRPFSITREQLQKYTFEPFPIAVSEIAKKINSLTDSDEMEKIGNSAITSFLIKNGYLEVTLVNGKRAKTPTKLGNSIGISRQEKQGVNGPYVATFYNIDAQRFILDHIDEIIASQNPAYNNSNLQGQMWSQTHDDVLIDLFNKNVPISEIAITLKRSEGAIQARLKKHGLIQ